MCHLLKLTAHTHITGGEGNHITVPTVPTRRLITLTVNAISFSTCGVLRACVRTLNGKMMANARTILSRHQLG